MLEDENLVAHDDTHERDETEDAGQADGNVGDAQTYHGSRQTEQDGYHAEGCQTEAPEVEEQEEENDDQRNGKARNDVGHCLQVLFRLAANLGAHAEGQREVVVQNVLYLALHFGCQYAALAFGSHRHATLAATVHYFAGHPARLHACHLSERNAAEGLRQRRDVEILHVAHLHLLSLSVAQNDGHLVVPLPDGADRRLACLHGKL